MNTLRVFLHDLLWQQDSTGFIKRLDLFLKICQEHGIRPILVLFDSVWDPEPRLGKQREPRPGIHNSGWVQSPGSASLKDESQHPRLETYVKGIVKVFANDKRILAWDVWNEPDNMNTDNYPEPADKIIQVNNLLPKVFDWCRSAQPMQPLTSGVWITWDGHNWSDSAKWTVTERIQLQQSDIISFHCYSDSATFEKLIQYLLPLGRPLLCTEYLARGYKNTFEAILPLGRKYNVAMINWGFVAGKTQTYLPWDSWKQPYVNGRQPAVWHHEIFYPDGKPYRKEEVELLRRLTGKTTISQ
jgi:hypothetical protein